VNLTALITELEQRSGAAPEAWRVALESARSSLKVSTASDTALEALALASDGPAAFQKLTRLLYQVAKTDPTHLHPADVFLKRVSDSPYSLEAWLLAVSDFLHWLETRGRSSDFNKMTGYLECCCASPEARGGHETLPRVLARMLAAFDFEG